MAAELYVENDCLVRIHSVVNAITEEPISDMEGTVTVYDLFGNAMPDADSLPISYASAAANPFFYAVIPETVALIAGTVYTVIFQSSNYAVRLEKPFTAKKRTG